MSNSIKNLYQFRTKTKILKSSTTDFEITEDVYNKEAVSLTGAYIVLKNRTGTKVEIMQGDATGGTFTITKRGIGSDGTVDSDRNQERSIGTICKVVLVESQIFDKNSDSQTIDVDITYSGDVEFNQSMKFPVYADATARDAGIPSPSNGMMIYNTALGLVQQYVSGAWVNVDTGTGVANASTTVAGKAEQSTSAEHKSGDATGSTGAPLFSSPATIQASIQKGEALYALASSEGDDDYVVALTPAITAYTTGMNIIFKADVANTGACTINVNTVGVKSIKTVDGNDPQDGAIRAGQLVQLVYDGTNFVMQNEDSATTTNKGIIEKATPTETQDGTADKYPDAKEIKDTYERTFYMSGGTIFEPAIDSTNSYTKTHGLGKTPNLIVVDIYAIVTNGGNIHICTGYYDVSSNSHRGIRVRYNYNSANDIDTTTAGLYQNWDSGETKTVKINNVDETSFDIEYTDSSNGPGGNYEYNVIAYT